MPKDVALVVADEEEDPNMSQKDIVKTLRKRACTMVTSVFAELLICYVYTNWSIHAEEDPRMQKHAMLAGVNSDVHLERIALWSVFGSCLVLRLLCIFFWTRDCGPDSVWAALHMFFSSAPFICYWIIFFEMRSQLLVRHVNMHVPSTYEDVAGVMTESCTQEFVAGECDGGVLINGMNCCMWNTYDLVMAGGGQVPLFGYEETLSINNWYGMVLKWASILSMSWVWKDMPLLAAAASDTAFMNDVWIDILDAAVFADYVINPWVVSYNFELYNDGASGSSNGRQCTGGVIENADGVFSCGGWLQATIFNVWVVAFFASILAPTIWTAFRFLDTDGKDDQDIDGLLGDFTTHVRMLDRGEAKNMVDPLIQAQVKAYQEADGDREDSVHPVLVSPAEGGGDGWLFAEDEDEEASGSMADFVYAFRLHVDEQDNLRPALATYDPENPGCYLVTYTDGDKEEEVVHVSRLQPDTEDHQKMCGKKCCKGWCQPSYLRAEDRPTQQFERRGNYYDAIRSCFLLEIPFFIYRFHFIILSGNSRIGTGTILLLKNAIFMCLDFLHVLACGNVKATCLNFTPIDKFEKFVKGSKLNSIFVGPGGMFKLAADLTTKGLQEQAQEVKDRLNMHKAWLILEREKAQKDRDEAKAGQREAFEQECQDFTAAIEGVEKKIKTIDTKMKAVHM